MPGDPHLPDIAKRVQRNEGLCPEQIASFAGDEAPTAAALVDQWGRAHWLKPVTVIGRELGENDLVVLESSVSRSHAELRCDADGNWKVRDLGSTNGTFVEGRRIEDPVAISDGERLTVGDVGFAFHGRGAELFDRQAATESINRTSKAVIHGEGGPILHLLGPAPGGGGIVECGGQYVQLGPTQYSLVSILAERWLADGDSNDAVRGFVRSIDLITDLPWSTPYPEDNNVKQLVRRVRRAFERAGVDDPVESRHGFGYRLRFTVDIHRS